MITRGANEKEKSCWNRDAYRAPSPHPSPEQGRGRKSRALSPAEDEDEDELNREKNLRKLNDLVEALRDGGGGG